MVERHLDWLRTAQRDLAMAEVLLKGGFFEGSAFHALQSAEKAIKALYQRLNINCWGHSVYQLLKELPENMRPKKELMERVKDLDFNYILSRYPNGFDNGAPEDYYDEEDAKRSISLAQEVLRFCATGISGPGKSP